MAIRKLSDGSIEADTPAELHSYEDAQADLDLRSVSFNKDETTQRSRGGFITPLFCFLPTQKRNFFLTPLACFYRPSRKR